MSNLTEHAKHELELAGLFDKDSDYEGAVGKAVMELVEVFSKQEHSGFSAQWVLDTFKTVASFKTITPVGKDPSEWIDVSEASGKPMWQNKRQSSLFSKDGGKTFYDIDKPKPVTK